MVPTLLAASFLFTFVSSFIPVEVTAENASAAEFGYPIQFVTADTGLSPPPGETSHVGWDFMEYPADFHWPQFFASWAIVGGSALLAFSLLVAAQRRARSRPLRPSARPSV
jgi:hypothetical protein